MKCKIRKCAKTEVTNAMVINIISLNTRGLRESNKRRAIFNFYRKKCHVMCLQETHSQIEDADLWTAEWGGRAYYSHGVTNARGVAIFVNKSLRDKITVVDSDSQGRVISVVINHNDENVCLTNIYGPNHDAPGFFENCVRRTQSNCDKFVIIGDFNVIPNPVLDKKGDAIQPHPLANTKIENLKEELHLCDAWRMLNPEKKRYSWYRAINKPSFKVQASRLDYAIVSNNLGARIHDSFYLNGLQSDHSAFFLGIELSHVQRGTGYWKFNTTYLHNPEFIQVVNQYIQEAKVDLAHLSACDKWEVFKDRMQRKCKEISRRSISEEKLIISQLNEKIVEMEEEIETLTEREYNLLIDSKCELEELVGKQIEGIMFRSKAKWAMESEMNTKYFLNLEKNRYGEKTCYALYKETGQITRDPDEIQTIQECFFRELYSSDSKVEFSLPNMVQETVKPSSEAASEERFNEEEIQVAIKGLKNGSCPGNDGFPIEFYKVFWIHIKDIFCEMIEEVFENKLLPKSLRTGILNLIPKGEKDVKFLKNLRPITLLNTDYKIIEKMIANRMVPSLMQLIHEDQKGFLPERRICANIRKLLDVVCESIALDQECTILSCDFMKCFDRIETDCIIEGMKMFAFSETLISWVRIIYSQFTIKIQNNGNFSRAIPVTRSVRQGGPASNALFIVVSELLAIMLRENQEINGIFLHDILHFLNQFADDMDICMRHDSKTIQDILGKFTEFERSTGFKLSYEKTTLYRTGSLKDSNAKLYTEKNLNWSGEKINVLGIEVMNDQQTCVKVNYEKVLEKMEVVLSAWDNRNISLCGKIIVINTLIASLFVYKMQVLPKIPEDMIVRAEKMMEKYIWNGHKPKIPLAALQNSPENGGLKLVNLRSKDAALKSLWIKMLMNHQYSEELVYRILNVESVGNMLWCCNLKSQDVPHVITTDNSFWKDVLSAWCMYHYTEEDRGDEVIWLNSKIRIKGKPVLWPKVADKLTFISDILKTDGYIDSLQAQSRFGLGMMEFNALKSAIPNTLKKSVQLSEGSFKDNRFRRYMASPHPSQIVYWEIVPESEIPVKRVEKLEEHLCEEIDISVRMRELKRMTVVQKLRSFQYRQLMNSIVTNIQLYRWKIKDSEMCTLCNSEPETVYHMLFGCVHVKDLWEEVRVMSLEQFACEVHLSYRNILLCDVSGTYCAINLMCLITKQFIYRCRCKNEKPNRYQLRREILRMKNIEKYYAKKNCKMVQFCKKWRDAYTEDPETLSQINSQLS